ncbi:response regulator transcription factor [Pseudoalteromonas issachenkonii]|uniref:Response regulator transcription factor n=1 Tax=Pseudoalteromonas issachenkonii TaxID=152297 RepID=A0ABU9H546_9GAMM
MLVVKSAESLTSKLENSGIKYKVTNESMKADILDEFLDGILVLISSPVDLELEYQLLNRKASGVLWLPIKNGDLEEVIDTLNNGGRWFSRVTLTRKISDFIDNVDCAANINSFGFTKREKQIIDQIKLGLSNKEIARNKCISEATVKSHIKNILAKTNTKNRTALLIQLSK